MDSKEIAAKKSNLENMKAQINNDLRGIYEILGMIVYESTGPISEKINLDKIPIKESEKEGFIKQIKLAKQQHDKIQELSQEIIALDSIVICPKCGNPKDYEGEFCIFCGAHIGTFKASETEEAEKCCVKCGAKLDKDAVFCHICGQKQSE